MKVKGAFSHMIATLFDERLIQQRLEVERSWRERLFSRPWKPWKKFKWVVIPKEYPPYLKDKEFLQ